MAIPITLLLGIKLSALTSENRFIKLTSRLAVIGIMLGVATLISVLSIMNGFEYEIRHRLVKDFDHLQIFSFNDQYPEALYEEIRALPHVVSVKGYAEAYGLVQMHRQYIPLLLLAIESSDVPNNSIRLSHDDTMYLAKKDKVSIIMPSKDKMMPIVSDLKYIGGVEDKHIKSQSIVMGQVSYPVYQKVTGKRNLTGLSVVVDDLYATEAIKKHIKKRYGGIYYVFDWKDKYQPLFTALRLQRTGMLLVLSMITIVAMFSLVSGLVMLSSDRKKEIALLRVMGMTKFGIKRLFLVQGSYIGFIGVSLGVLMGLLLCHFSQELASLIEYLVGYELIDERIYGTSILPVKIEVVQILGVSIISFIGSIVASIYPASKIAKDEPAEVLRYA